MARYISLKSPRGYRRTASNSQDEPESDPALNADPSRGVRWWGDEATTEYLLDVQASLDGGQNWTSLVLGRVDRIAIHADIGLCEVDGRDLTGYLVDAKAQESLHFQNHTASQIVAILAARHGMTADVTPTSTVVGRYYEIDHELTGAGAFSRTTTEWNLLRTLAQHEDFDVWITGTTLHVHPRSLSKSKQRYIVSWDQESRVSNTLTLAMEKPMSFAKDITVIVSSWHSGRARAISGHSGTTNAPAGAPRRCHSLPPTPGRGRAGKS